MAAMGGDVRDDRNRGGDGCEAATTKSRAPKINSCFIGQSILHSTNPHPTILPLLANHLDPPIAIAIARITIN